VNADRQGYTHVSRKDCHRTRGDETPADTSQQPFSLTLCPSPDGRGETAGVPAGRDARLSRRVRTTASSREGLLGECPRQDKVKGRGFCRAPFRFDQSIYSCDFTSTGVSVCPPTEPPLRLSLSCTAFCLSVLICSIVASRLAVLDASISAFVFSLKGSFANAT